MYSNYFGLSEPPFAIAPDPRFLYMSEQHREALAHLLYGINSNGGFVLLTGEVGTGKTTVSRCLLEQLPENTEIAFILNPQYTAIELLEAICDELGIQCRKEGELKDYVDAINEHLLENHRNDRHTVLIIDEAQNLSADVLETIRLLTNLETNTQKLLQIILIGQPELTDKLSQPELRQVNQRITARYHLRALSKEELPAYVAHRLSVAGVDGQLFPPSAIKRLYRLTQGIPRLVNIICDRALLGAYVQRENRVEEKTVGKAANEVFGDSSPHMSSHTEKRGVMTLAIAACLFASAALGYVLYTHNPDQSLMKSAQTVTTQVIEQGEQTLASITNQDDPGAISSGQELSNPANWQWPTGTNTSRTEVQAYKVLMQQWNLTYEPKKQPAVCRFAETNGLRCLFNIGSLDELINLNRPAVLKLFNAKGQNFFGTLLSVKNNVAEVAIGGEVRRVKVDDLKLWVVGKYTVMWRVPEHYKAPIQPGMEGPEVIWLDRQLALSQSRAPRYFRLQTYDGGLVRQVKRFQASNGLVPDGVVGPHTAILLNSVSDRKAPMLKAQRGEA